MRKPVHALWALGLVAAPAWAATPAEGTLTVDSTELSYSTGPMPIANVSGLPQTVYTCDATNPCDIFTLTTDFSEEFIEKHRQARFTVVTTAIPEYADIDLQLADGTGKNLATVRDNPPEQPMLSYKVKAGVNTFQVQIVPGTPVPDANATITFIAGPESKSGIDSLAGGGLGLLTLIPLLALGLRRRV